MNLAAFAWVALVVSGVLEAVWAMALAKSHGFTRWKPVVVFVLTLLVSTVLLAFAMAHIPTGTAYAFWVGIGAAATVGASMWTGAERASVAKIVLIFVLIASVIGLKVVS